MRRAGHVVKRQELLQEVWGAQPGTDSNLVDVYVNYLRKKIERLAIVRKGATRIREEDRLLHTIRGIGYRLGREAPTAEKFFDLLTTAPEPQRNKNQAQSGSGFSTPEPPPIQPAPWRTLVASVAHDLAQPLTSVRCFLEMAALRKGNLSSSPSDLKSIEQQADRAIALAKAITSLVREIPVPIGLWISLDSILQEVLEDSSVLTQSGLLTVERQWDASLQVTSNPILRQLLVLLMGKLVGKNTRPITLLVSAEMKGSRCCLELRWRATEGGSVQDAQAILGNELINIEEMVYSVGGELTIEGDTGIVLTIPAVRGESQVVH